jgi:hypothetical protein
MVMVECDGDEREIECGDVGIARNPEHKRERWREAWMRSRLSSAERQVRRTGTRGMECPSFSSWEQSRRHLILGFVCTRAREILCGKEKKSHSLVDEVS